MQKLTQLAPVTITTAGTRVSVSSSAIATSLVTVVADSLNTGKIYLGDETVSSSNGIELSAGQSVSIAASDVRGNSDGVLLSDLWLDSASNGNKARVFYFRGR